MKTDLTSEEYVNQQAWRDASLERCPLHPDGGCSLARHGTYGRKKPAGTQITRLYCPEGHTTFSLLPDCFAARLPGTLVDVETVVEVAEQAISREAAADVLRPDIELPGGLRWLRRRLLPVYAALQLLKGLMADQFHACWPTLAGFRACLGSENLLLVLREVAAVHLHVLPPPLGFCPPPSGGKKAKKAFQHAVGPDPPGVQR